MLRLRQATAAFLLLVCQAAAFVPVYHAASTEMNLRLGSSFSAVRMQNDDEVASAVTPSSAVPAVAGLIAALAPLSAAAEEMELAELPPPWIPAVFSLFLIAAVGVLTGSLGNVIDEEASLGLQSGARAKKEIDRSRSSYFKKR